MSAINHILTFSTIILLLCSKLALKDHIWWHYSWLYIFYLWLLWAFWHQTIQQHLKIYLIENNPPTIYMFRSIVCSYCGKGHNLIWTPIDGIKCFPPSITLSSRSSPSSWTKTSTTASPPGRLATLLSLWRPSFRVNSPLRLSQARMCWPHNDFAWVTTSWTDTVRQPSVVESFRETASLTLENRR